MRICVDLDGVICQLRRPGQSYSDVEPVPGAVDALRQWRSDGHTVIIYTARHMKTTGGNVGLVLARQGSVTLDWLAQHGVEFDEIHFGKPYADVYIDDNAVRFASWAQLTMKELPESREQTFQGDGGI